MIEQRPVSSPASASRRGRAPSPLEPSASAAARLGAGGSLMRLLPAVILEQAQHRSDCLAARRRADVDSDLEHDLEPVHLRGP
jgi:hypothetical protein